MGSDGGHGEQAALGAEHPEKAWPGGGPGWGASQRAERRLIQPELAGCGCIYHPITVTNPGSTT